MKRSIDFKIAAVLFASSMMLLSACSKEVEDSSFPAGNPETGTLLNSRQEVVATYIVVLNDDFEAPSKLKAISDYDNRNEVMTGDLNRYLNGKGIDEDQVENVYSTVFPGFSAKLNPQQLQRLQQDPRVKSIEPDQVITLGKPVATAPPRKPQQVIPWGVTRVGGPVNSVGISKKAWVVATGIDLDHPDLNVNRTLSRTFVTGDNKSKGDDGHGHGTAMAGCIAAIDNGFGTVGVAAGATLVALRVLNALGTGTYSWAIAGIDYAAATATPGDVVCIGFVFPPSPELDQAVQKLADKGIQVAMSAGYNGELTFGSPSRLDGPNLYTITAMGENDTWYPFSNYGPHVDYIAPAVSCYTTALKGTYTTVTTISPAVAHVAGLLLLGNVNSDGYVICPGDGSSYAIAHR